MFGKKFLIAAAAYIGGTVVATIFSSKKGEKVREDLKKANEKGEGTKEILIANFIDTHKNFLEDLKSKVLTEENKEFVYKKIDEAKELVKEYKKEGEKMIDELKEKGENYVDTAKKDLEELYENKKADLVELQKKAPEKIEKTKEKLIAKFDEVKDKITK